MGKVLILRPRPGAEETEARARAMGLDPVAAPLFHVRPLAWGPPDPQRFAAVMLTSAHAARLAGPALARFLHLPCYAVGEATGRAAREAGFTRVTAGERDAAALLGTLADDGIARILHLCGRDRVEAHRASMSVERLVVYAADAADRLPPAAQEALDEGAVALLHSARAAALFASLTASRAGISIAALSPTVALAAGEGWRQVAAAPSPRDEALLELAAKLCENAA